MAMVRFFDLLPEGLQLDILSLWIGHHDEQLFAFSALDIACNKATRRPVRSLIARCPFTRETGQRKPIKRVMEYLLWLSTRKVAVKSLCLDSNTVVMP